MTTFQLTINTGNDAIQDETDIAETLRTVAELLELDASRDGKVKDLNGNTIGSFTLTPTTA